MIPAFVVPPVAITANTRSLSPGVNPAIRAASCAASKRSSVCTLITSTSITFAIARTEEEIKLIREYRDRLIADVVTGQVDVRGWQPSPEDVVDDATLAALGDDQDDVTEEEDGDGED